MKKFALISGFICIVLCVIVILGINANSQSSLRELSVTEMNMVFGGTKCCSYDQCASWPCTESNDPGIYVEFVGTYQAGLECEGSPATACGYHHTVNCGYMKVNCQDDECDECDIRPVDKLGTTCKDDC